MKKITSQKGALNANCMQHVKSGIINQTKVEQECQEDNSPTYISENKKQTYRENLDLLLLVGFNSSGLKFFQKKEAPYVRMLLVVVKNLPEQTRS